MKTHLLHVHAKLDVRDRASAVAAALPARLACDRHDLSNPPSPQPAAR